jgi:hypothetical protein
VVHVQTITDLQQSDTKSQGLKEWLGCELSFSEKANLSPIKGTFILPTDLDVRSRNNQ